MSILDNSHASERVMHLPLLADKRAVIFGAGGSVGSAVAREFAAQGAALFLSGRHLAAVERAAAETERVDRVAEAAQINAEDEVEVNAYLERVVQQAGSLDVVLNLVGLQPREFSHGTNTLDVSLEDYLMPLMTLVRSQFITARAAARHMVRQRSGVILFVTALPSRGMANVPAIGSAFGAMESLARCLAVDLGPGRGASPWHPYGGNGGHANHPAIGRESRAQAIDSRDAVLQRFGEATLLKRPMIADDTAQLAAFLASDSARAMTGTIVNASGGSFVD